MKDHLESFWQKHNLPSQLLNELLMTLEVSDSGFDRDPTDVVSTPPDILADEDTPSGVAVLGEQQRYEMLSVIAIGGTGEVWRVRDQRLERELAMKVMRAEQLQSSRGVAKFLSEARLAARLQHPGLVPVHDMGSLADGRLFFTMPEIHGRTLKEVSAELHKKSSNGTWTITADGWTLRALIDALRRVCKTVQYAHENGIIHRDLKPANILLGKHDEVFVLDWGSAFLSERYKNKGSRTVSGTPAYMAPEQMEGKVERIDQRTDVYALGATLYALLTGHHPWKGLSLPEIIQTLMNGNEQPRLPSPSSHALALPSALTALCELALSPDPDDRLQSADEFAAALDGWLEGVSTA